VAVASLSGESDAAWARAAAPYVGAAFLGGLAIDGPTREAARAMVDRGRDEFLPEDPVAFVADQLDALSTAPLRPAVNVRTTTVDPLVRVADACAARGAAVEVNAHCRQAEMCAAGCGERLLRDGDRLATYVAAAAGTGATVSVKLRTEVDGVDLPTLAGRLADAGADWLHVDAMDSEPVVAAVRRAAPGVSLIANNGVRDAATAREYRRYGADAVSIGRASDDPATLERVRREAVTWTAPDADGATDAVRTDVSDASSASATDAADDRPDAEPGRSVRRPRPGAGGDGP
jgi:TIM-barrel protein